MNPSPDNSKPRPKILLVDDQPSFREQAAFFLEMEGFEVKTACNGVDGLEILNDFTPDLILADLMMPRMNGFDFYRNLRRRECLMDVPVIFVTARDRPLDTAEGLSLTEDDFVAKPFDPDSLLTTIHNKLGSSGFDHQEDSSLPGQPTG